MYIKWSCTVCNYIMLPLPIRSTLSSLIKWSGSRLACSVWVIGSGWDGLPWSASLGLPTRIFLTCQKYLSSDQVARRSRSTGDVIVYWSSRRSSWSTSIREAIYNEVWNFLTNMFPTCIWSYRPQLELYSIATRSGQVKFWQLSSRGPVFWVEVV